MFKRLLDLPSLLEKKSFFLLGPRSTGKSFLIRTQLQTQALIINLLESRVYSELLAHPFEIVSLLRSESEKKLIVIDAVQRIPALLNEVHRLIEEQQYRFLSHAP